jgi:hypothetical protein
MNRKKRIVLLAALFLLTSAAAAYALRGEIVEVALYRSARMVNGVPAGWKIMRHSGTPVIRLEKFGDAYYVRLASDSRSGFGLEKEVSVDLKEYPYLNWTWTATRLPRGGDVRKSATDDQALQIYVVLPSLLHQFTEHQKPGGRLHRRGLLQQVLTLRTCPFSLSGKSDGCSHTKSPSASSRLS